MEQKNQALTLSETSTAISLPIKDLPRILRGVNTLEKCICSGTPTIGALNREQGEKATLMFIEAWVATIQDSLNVRHKMTVTQIEMCAEMIYSDYKALNVADLNLIHRKALLGEYGQLYESISTPKIMEWIQTYFNERCDVGQGISERQAQQYKRENMEVVKAIYDLGIIEKGKIGNLTEKEKQEKTREVYSEWLRKKHISEE